MERVEADEEGGTLLGHARIGACDIGVGVCVAGLRLGRWLDLIDITLIQSSNQTPISSLVLLDDTDGEQMLSPEPKCSQN